MKKKFTKGRNQTYLHPKTKTKFQQGKYGKQSLRKSKEFKIDP